jgi:rubredoxin
VERFAVIGSGEAECKSCQYVYEPKMGDENYPVAKGTRFENLPPDWRCPVCGAEKKMFESRSKVVAGFRQNQGAQAHCNMLLRCLPARRVNAAPNAALLHRLRHRRQHDDRRAKVAAHLRCDALASTALLSAC